MALGPGTINSLGGAAEALFSAKSYRMRAQGQRLEAEQYDLAGVLARKNEQFAKTSTELKTAQEERRILKTLGGQAADVAASGFAEGGSSLDIMRDSQSQGALTVAVVKQQGLIEEESYETQAKSFDLMASASRLSAEASEEAAKGALWSAGFKGAAAVASLFTGGGFELGSLFQTPSGAEGIKSGQRWGEPSPASRVSGAE